MSEKLTRAERYKLSLNARKEGNEQAFGDYPKEEHPEYCNSEKGTPMLFRPMTMGSELLPKTPFDHRFFYQSFMKDDEGKFFPFKWGFEDWYSHPIYKIVKKVAKYEYNAEKKSRKYDNEGCELLADITHNGDIENSMTSGWKPPKTLLMNVIDRMDSWCKENNHSKVATNRAEYDEDNDRWKTDYGIKTSQYNDMVSLAEKQIGSITDFDFLTIKYKKAKKVGDKHEYYETLLAEQTKPYIEEHYGEDYVKAIYEDYSDEEMDYEKYNFEEMSLYKPSSIGFFLSKKGQFVKSVDEKYGTSFFQELTNLANDEKRANGETVEETTEAPKVETKVEEKKVEVEEEKPTTRTSRTSKVESKGFNPKDLDPTIFKGLAGMSDDELSNIIGIDSDGNLELQEGLALEPCEGGDCGKSFPLDWKRCIYCDREYV